ncbi:NACHT domain-containing protein [Micromonospora chalcea]|uniref:NACHT domain-containing protein n=1 Tax=Micromonospora chalcea TaxID=1874 RepID=UPI00364E76A3
MVSEGPIFSLSVNVVATVTRVWFSRHKANQSILQLLEDQVPDALERRRLMRTLEGMVEVVADRLMREIRTRNIAEDERDAAIAAVSESLNAAALTKEDLQDAAMSPTTIAELVRARTAAIRAGVSLSSNGAGFYHALIDEASSILVTIVTSMPTFDRHVIHQLMRQDDLITSIEDILERLPSSAIAGPAFDPLAIYRRSVVSALDRSETVGFPVFGSANALRLSETFVRPDVLVGGTRQPLDWALADHPRVFIHGPAGSGKTSILRWLAINAGRQSLDGPTTFLNDMLPVYVPLRHATARQEPVADADHLARVAFPPFEVEDLTDLLQQACESGSALLLFDGLDEINPTSRRTWLEWLVEMTARYPDSRFVITSRTSPFDADSLADEHFTTVHLAPLDGPSKKQLIRQWFTATKPLDQGWSELTPGESAARVNRLIESNSRLHDLAATPLMCALMCALFSERGELPLRGPDVYAGFVDMLVERRDTERGIAGIRALPKPEALMLLEGLAEFMVLSGVTEIPRSIAQKIVAGAMTLLPRLEMDAGAALEHLLTRSGLLIEPAHGRTQFVHLTLMEFLAARSFIENDSINILVERAHDPAWHSVVVLAASQARPWQGEKLVEGLLQRSRKESKRQLTIAAVLQASVTSMVRLSPSLRHECEALWRREIDAHPYRVLVQLEIVSPSDRSAIDELCRWVAEDDELRRSGPVVVSKVQNNPSTDALVVAGGSPLDSMAVVRSVLEWYRMMPPGVRSDVHIEVDGFRIAVTSSLEW